MDSAIKTPRVLFIKTKKRWLGLRWQEADLGVFRILELRSETDCSDARLFTVSYTFRFVVGTPTERRRQSVSHIKPPNRSRATNQSDKVSSFGPIANTTELYLALHIHNNPVNTKLKIVFANTGPQKHQS